MRRVSRRPAQAARTLALLAAVGFALTASARLVAADRSKDKGTDLAIGDVAEPTGGPPVMVEGVGLVIGLQDTGSDPTPSWYRDKLLGELKRNPNLDAEAILASRKTSLVIVRGVIPAGVAPTDTWDVEISLPPGSTTTSLEGGFLMETELAMVGIASNGPMEGKPLAKAHGPVLTGSANDPSDLKSGRVLGGSKSKQSRPYILYINERHQSGRMAKRLEDVVNMRFHQRGAGGQTGMSVAKSDKHLELKVPRHYHQNQIRYLQVIKSLRLTDTPELFEQRLADWGKELLDPKTSGAAAIKLESLGKNAADTLKKGLESPSPQVRFFSAEALAYLDDPTGVDELARAVEIRPEFRVFALAALAAMDQPAAMVRLRELLSKPDPQIRYGAFNALRTADPRDPYLGRVRVLQPPPRLADAEDEMALQTAGELATPRSRALLEDPFELYVVDSDGPPMVHVSRSRRCEIVLFGRGMKLAPPVVLGGSGPLLLNASVNDPSIEITRIEAGQNGLLEQTRTCPNDVVSVIRGIAQMGATYPQVVAILESAQKQANLTGAFLADALPSEGDKYDQAQMLGAEVAKADPAVQRTGLEQGTDEARQNADGEPTRRNPLQRLRERFRRGNDRPSTGGSD